MQQWKQMPPHNNENKASTQQWNTLQDNNLNRRRDTMDTAMR
jgi:hypothetical protein